MSTKLRKLPIGDVHVCTNRPCVHLTAKEADTMRLVRDGQTNPQIAYRQGVTPHTVKNRLRQMFRKLGVSSRTELVVYGFRGGLFK